METSKTLRFSKFILAGLFLLVGNLSHAEIVELDINQMMVGPGTVDIDLNGDGSSDYRFEIIELSANYYSTRVTSLGMSAVMDKTNSGFPTALSFGDVVSGPFINGDGILGMQGFNSEFGGAGDAYLGIKMAISGQYFKGWFLINCSVNNDSMTILKGAYNTQEDDGIIAGQDNSNSSISSDLNSQFSIYPNPCKDILFLKGLENGQTENYAIYFMNGVLVEKGPLNNSIDITSLKAGQYILRIENTNGTIQRTFSVYN